MFKIAIIFVGMFVIDAYAIRAIAELETIIARKGSPASRRACRKAMAGTSVHRRCVNRFWCNTDKLKRAVSVAEMDLVHQHLKDNGCPEAQMDYLRERECMRYCARPQCDKSACTEFCRGVSLESLVFGAQLEGSFTRKKRSLTSKREITVKKIEELRACLGREGGRSVESAKALDSLKSVDKKLHGGIVKKLGKLKNALISLYEAPHLLQRGWGFMNKAKRQGFDTKRAAQFAFNGAAYDAWRKKDLVPTKEFDAVLKDVIEIEIEPLAIKQDYRDKPVSSR